MALPTYASLGQRVWYYTFRFICALIFIFLITPILVVLPLSFNAEDFFTFTPEMLRFDPEGYSLKHYRDFFSNNEWQRSFKNSLIIAPIATIISCRWARWRPLACRSRTCLSAGRSWRS